MNIWLCLVQTTKNKSGTKRDSKLPLILYQQDPNSMQCHFPISTANSKQNKPLLPSRNEVFHMHASRNFSLGSLNIEPPPNDAGPKNNNKKNNSRSTQSSTWNHTQSKPLPLLLLQGEEITLYICKVVAARRNNAAILVVISLANSQSPASTGSRIAGKYASSYVDHNCGPKTTCLN